MSVNAVVADAGVIEAGDARTLGYREAGCASGRPVLYCHGLPGSRLEAELLHGAATRHGLRVIGLERPGYGVTSPLPDRAIGDETHDVAAIADRLALDEFDVVGFSGGGPTALACAARLPDRVARVSLVGSWAPFGEAGLDGMLDAYRQLWELAGVDFPAFVQALTDALDQAGGAYELLLGGAPERDRAILEQPGLAEAYRRDLVEALRQPDGMLDDAAAVVSEWTFACADVHCPVQLLHGEDDGNAPVAMAHWLHARLPQAELKVWPGATHFEAFRRWDEILATHGDR